MSQAAPDLGRVEPCHHLTLEAQSGKRTLDLLHWEFGGTSKDLDVHTRSEVTVLLEHSEKAIESLPSTQLANKYQRK